MPQRVRFDRAVGALYLAGLAACSGSGPGPLVPVSAQPVGADVIEAWVAPTRPDGSRLLRFRWLFRDERSSAGGRGSARIAAPDSLRFDVQGPLGSGAAAAVVVRHAPVWVDPPDAIERLVPSYPLMWAMLGVAERPDAGAELAGLDDGRTTLWRYAAGADTTEYARTPRRMVAEVRRGGRVVGRVTTEFDEEGALVRSRLLVPDRPAQLDINFTASATPDSFPSDVWLPRAPQ